MSQGFSKKRLGQPLQPSLNLSSAHAFASVDALVDYHHNPHQSVRYARDTHELLLELEHTFSQRHQGWPALLMSSGMTSISLAIEALLEPDCRLILIGQCYRKTQALFDSLSQKYAVDWVQYKDLDAYQAHTPPDPRDIVFVETPSNPFLRLVDLAQLRAFNPRARILVDATFQGLDNDRGLLEQADLVIHSCTKYIGGHNDLLAGLVLFPNPDFYTPVWNERSLRGGGLDNLSAYLLHRSLKTYELRIQAALTNTQQTLAWLALQPQVTAIYYPGAYRNQDQHTLFQQTHYQGGCVVTFEVQETLLLKTNLTHLQTLKMAPSFGSVDSLIEIPAYMSHYGKDETALAELGLTFHQIRLSLGIEPFAAIHQDLQRLLHTPAPPSA